jgi:hypothetical protein
MDVGKDCRFVKESLREISVRQAMAATHQLCPFITAYLHVFLYGPELACIDAGPHLDRGIQSIPDAERFRAADEFIQEFLVDFFVGYDPAGGRTALAGSAEPSPYRALHSQIQFGVIHDQDNVLPPHLEVMVLEVRRAFLGYGVPYRSRARERYESDFFMT